jgi:AraC family transcriptional regulator, regulatory protein of adaptative response / methylated-DNA-[protein]-cysteine methyltransferase
MASNQQLDLNPAQAWQQVLSRDASASFVYAVASTGIFCRPSCPSRRPAQTNVRFFSGPSGALAEGYRACKRCAPLGERDEAATVAKLCRYLAAHCDRTVTLADLAKVARSSPFTVQRKFTRVLGLSPRAYQAQLRSTSMRRSLSTPGSSITGAIYEAGYGSSSRFYEQAATDLGMSPTRFRERGLNETIRFATARCELGLLLVAATDRGVCSVMFGDEAAALEKLLRQQFSAANLVKDAPGMAEQMTTVLAAMSERPMAVDIPLDLRATAFQARVWQALREIPRGQTRSYADVARAVGQPTAVRAVARACATNPVAIAVPCHRVIGSDGSLTGYRWGTERKKKLLAMER